MIHSIEPYYNRDSKVLILGSFPSVTSREKGFYYAHPKNRFWHVLSNLFHEDIKDNIISKKSFLKKHKIALYDVCFRCDIHASSDATIKNVLPSDLEKILKNSQIKHIFLNGKTATNLFRLHFSHLDIPSTSLPSTSPANARWSINSLTQEYQKMLNYL